MDKLLALSLLAILAASLCEAKVLVPEFAEEQEIDVENVLEEALKISKMLGPGWAVEPLPAEEERDIEPEPEPEPEEELKETEAVNSTDLGWYNRWDQAFDFRCHHTYEGIYRIRSIHNNHKEDRLFQFYCKQVYKRYHARCHWTGYVNHFDRPVNFNCGRNKYLGGMGSIHNNHYEDRIWRFFCCSMPHLRLGHCYRTFWTNDWDRPQDFKVPYGYILTGVKSYHNNHTEDRRFAYTFCKRY